MTEKNGLTNALRQFLAARPVLGRELKALEESEKDAEAVALQRDDLRARLDRIRAAIKSDPAFEDAPALRDFLLRETEPGVLHVPGVSGEARTTLLRDEP